MTSFRPRTLTRATVTFSFALVFLAAPEAPGAAATPPVGDAVAKAARCSAAGTVTSADGSVVEGVEVSFVDLALVGRTDAAGQFSFDEVPAGVHLLQASHSRWGAAIAEVDLSRDCSVTLDLQLDRKIHLDEVFVSAGATARATDDIPQGASVLTGEELSSRQQATLGETLSAEPGITSTYFGPGASRPLIRGLGGDRIRILQNGLDVGDASNTSPDHAAGADPASADRIEILRGPATLLYGSSAIGGVVNVVSDAIPTSLPAVPITGSFEVRGGDNANNRAGSAHLSGRAGSFAWHMEGFAREADDVEVPGDAFPQDPDEESQAGSLENSFLDSNGGAVGLAWIGSKGSFGISVRSLDSRYGVPGGHHGEDEHEGEGEHAEEDEEHVSIDLDQQRIDLRGLLTAPLGPFRTIKMNLGFVDYEHVELEGDEFGTRFENNSWEARIDGAQIPVGRWSGDVGVQASNRDFSAVGEEAFVAPTTTRRAALFALEQVELGSVKLLAGGRFENQQTSSEDQDLPDRDLDGFSASLGAVWEFRPDWVVAANVARSTKLPTAEELYSNGPHLATNAFEVGDANLSKERSLGVDLALRRTGGRFRGELSLFQNRFDDFIYASRTGGFEGDLPVYHYRQDDTVFTGFEAELHVDLLELEPHHLEVELSFDQVHAEFRATESPLPQIPAQRYGAALLYRGDRFDGRVEVRHTSDQNRVAEFETPTEGSTVVNASFGLRLFLGNTLHRLELRGTNLTDEVVRVHTSFLKDEVVAPGRDISLMYRLDF